MTSDEQDKTAAPLVSVLVPIYNVERYLRPCLESLKAQDVDDFEVICLNDGSTDTSPQIIREFVEADDRFRMIDKTNSGYGDSMNRGLDAARGRYVAILESDDVMCEGALGRLLREAEEHDAEVVKGNFIFWWSEEGREEAYDVLPPLARDGVFEPCRDPRVFQLKPSIWSAVYRRDFLEANGIRFLTTPGAAYQDTSFTFKVWACARRAMLLDVPVVRYRQDNEASSVNSQGKAGLVRIEYGEIERWLSERPLDGRTKVLWDAFQLARLNAYLWNLDRLAPELRTGFAHEAAADFERSEKDGTLDRMALGGWKKLNLDCLMRDPDGYVRVRGTSSENGLRGKTSFALRLGGPAALLAVASDKRHRVEASVEEDEGDVQGVAPCVSVVVPVYNSVRYVGECLDSLLTQEGPLQVICVDDGSSDGSADLLDARAAADARVTVIHQENAGPCAARNAGLARATGDILMFVDSDDVLAPGALRRIRSVFAEQAPDVLTFGFEIEPQDAAPASMRGELSPREGVYEEANPTLLFRSHAIPYAWRCAFSADFLRREGIRWNERLTVADDVAFLLEVYPASRRTVLIADRLYRYRVAEGSLTQTSRDFGDELRVRVARHLDCVEAVLARWRERGWQGLCPGELLEWVLSFLLLDIDKLTFEEQVPVYERLVSLLRGFFGQDLLASVRHLSTRTVVRMILRVVEGEDRRPPVFGPLDLPAFYLRYTEPRTMAARLAMRVVPGQRELR